MAKRRNVKALRKLVRSARSRRELLPGASEETNAELLRMAERDLKLALKHQREGRDD